MVTIDELKDDYMTIGFPPALAEAHAEWLFRFIETSSSVDIDKSKLPVRSDFTEEIINKTFNGYDYVSEEILKWWNDNHITPSDLVVTLEVDGFRSNEYVSMTGCGDSFEWEYDWWEGQPKEQIIIIGFTPVDEIQPLYKV